MVRSARLKCCGGMKVAGSTLWGGVTVTASIKALEVSFENLTDADLPRLVGTAFTGAEEVGTIR